MNSKQILDSGKRREFETGAVRDIVDGKGRCDLLPLDVVSSLLGGDVQPIMYSIYLFLDSKDNDVDHLYNAIHSFINIWIDNPYTAVLEVSKHYEEGCRKYGERNWEKGIPIHCYIDSGVRHLLKWFRGDLDEPHDRAFIWNMLGAIWTIKHVPDMIDI